MKKTIFAGVLCLALALAGCTGGTSSVSGDTAAAAPGASGGTAAASAESFDPARMINVITREDGSGTRGAFIELFGIEEKGDNGSKADRTTKEAAVAKATDVMLTSVAGDEYAIGYVSLGSMNDSVKALEIDGVQATAENVKSGTYQVARPFNIATKGEPAGVARDFIDYIMSAEGQQIVEESGYITVNGSASPFAGAKPEGKIVVAGSSSVAPVMEKLAEAYQAVNSGAAIEIQQSDSTAGMTAAMEGTCDIGMASRELKDAETAALTSTAIANDGIAVIVSRENPLAGLTASNVKDIFTGAATTWDAVKE